MDNRVFRLSSAVSAIFAVAILASVTVEAQVPKKPNMFQTKAACEAALKSGNFRYYEPKYFGLYNQNPVNGIDRVYVNLETDTCLRFHVVGGRKFVVQEEGTLMRALKLEDGSLVVYARDDCGNEAEGVTYPAPTRVVVAEPSPARLFFPPPDPPLVLTLPPQPRVQLPTVPQLPPPVETVYVREPEPQLLGWGVTGGGTLGAFSSVPVNGVVASITGRDVCADGRTYDFGLAIGGPKKSFWRITLMGMVVKDRSLTTYECQDCGIQVTTVSQGMRVLGSNVERVFMVGKKDWSIRPMISLHGGLGRVSGQATKYEGPVGRPATRVEQVGAEQLFGSKFLAFGGGDVGFMGDLGNQLTYTVAVVGVESPGVYYGRVQLTYWLK